MKTKINILLALAGGLTGGMLSRFVSPLVVSAQAQTQPQVTQEVRARSFVLVDADKRAVGTFTAERGRAPQVIMRPNQPPLVRPGPERIVLKDANGREIWSAGEGARVMPLEASR